MAQMRGRMVVVVGASAGGQEALKALLSQLPPDFPAPVLVVNHMAPDTTGDALVRALDAATALTCQHGKDGAEVQNGHVYIAPSDRHMLIEGRRILITKGARENRYRPAIDPLFRSAAVAHGNRVIGIILTGYLDDGTSGMMAIKRCGGLCIAQDPDDAAVGDMPRSVVVNVDPHHCLPIADMGRLLCDLVRRKLGPKSPPPKDIALEARIARRVLSDLPAVEELGDQAPFNCPDCGGVLWRIEKDDVLRYRCHTGHAFTSAVLLSLQSAKVEETLWTALRMFEERQNLLRTMGAQPDGKSSSAMLQRAEEAQVHIERIRAMLTAKDGPFDSMEDPPPGRRKGAA